MDNPFEQILQELGEIKARLNTLCIPTSEQVEIIDRSELLKRLGITEPTVIRWTKRGRIPEIRIGSHVRYNWSAVVKSLESSNK